MSDTLVASSSGAVHKCALSAIPVDQNRCQELSRVAPHNARGCCASQCASKWRLCIVCVRQGTIGKSAVVIDAHTGLCSFHTRNGKEAHRQPMEPNSELREVPRAKEVLQNIAVATPTLVDEGDDIEIDDSEVGELVLISTDLVHPNPSQPRKYFDPDELRALTESIRKVGQVQPGVINPLESPEGHYKIEDGERRWRACKALGRQYLARVRPAKDERTRYVCSVVANFNRANHTDLEEMEAVYTLVRVHGFKRREVVDAMGRSTAWIQQRLDVWEKVDPRVREFMRPELKKKRLFFTLAHALVHVPRSEQYDLAEQAVQNEWKLRDLQQHAGLSVEKDGGRGARPSDELDILTNGVQGTISKAKSLLAHTPTSLKTLWNRCAPQKRVKIHEEIDRLIEDLKRVKKALS